MIQHDMTDQPCTAGRPSGNTCLQGLAAGWINLTDLCPPCTRLAMRGLESVSTNPLGWHWFYTRRVQGPQS